MEICEGSYSGRYRLDAVNILYAESCNNPIEDIESPLPLRIKRYEPRDDSVSHGWSRGDIGSVRKFTYLADGGFSVEGDGHKHGCRGFDARDEGPSSGPVAATGQWQPALARLDRAIPEGAADVRSLGSLLPCLTTFWTASSAKISPGGATAWSSSMGGSMSNDRPTARRPHAG